MTEQPAGGRDVLAELDSVGEYLLGLIGDDPKPGQDANKSDLLSRLFHLKTVAQNISELHALYSSGVTHEQLVRSSRGLSEADTAAQARIADLERQLAEARGGSSAQV
jgi:hypothetical protein